LLIVLERKVARNLFKNKIKIFDSYFAILDSAGWENQHNVLSLELINTHFDAKKLGKQTPVGQIKQFMSI